jgi:uncharacterized protein (TIGR02246 family)
MTASATPLAPTTASSTQTGPGTPEELLGSFSRHVQRGEIDDLMALYEPDSVFVPQPGVVLRGLPAIREALLHMLALSPTMETNVLEMLESGDVALAIVEWTLHGTGADNMPVTQSGRSADVLRRQGDGTWRVVIDHP